MVKFLNPSACSVLQVHIPGRLRGRSTGQANKRSRCGVSPQTVEGAEESDEWFHHTEPNLQKHQTNDKHRDPENVSRQIRQATWTQGKWLQLGGKSVPEFQRQQGDISLSTRKKSSRTHLFLKCSVELEQKFCQHVDSHHCSTPPCQFGTQAKVQPRQFFSVRVPLPLEVNPMRLPPHWISLKF